MAWFPRVSGNLAYSENMERSEGCKRASKWRVQCRKEERHKDGKECWEKQEPTMSRIWVSCQEVADSKAQVSLWKACRLGSRDCTVPCSSNHSFIHVFNICSLRSCYVQNTIVDAGNIQ